MHFKTNNNKFPIFWLVFKQIISWETRILKQYPLITKEVPFPFLFSLRYPLVLTEHRKAIIGGVEGSKFRQGDNSRTQLAGNKTSRGMGP